MQLVTESYHLPHSLGLFIIKAMVAGIQALAFLLGITKIISFHQAQ